MAEPQNAATQSAKPRRSRSMAFRVVLVAVVSAAIGGLAAALVAIFAVDRLISEQANRRLLAATVTLAGELDEDPPKKRQAHLVSTLDDENDEIVSSGIRLAVFENQRPLAGDAWIRPPSPGQCEVWHVEGGRVRACSRAYHGWTLVAAQPTDEGRLFSLYVLAALGAVLLGAGVGAAASAWLTRWAVGPLEALSSALRRSRPEKPGALDLDPVEDCEEVEAIRAALVDLTAQVQRLVDQAERFAADAAHELRTPLTVLRAEVELMAEQASDNEQATLTRVGAQLSRLAELVERLLLLASPSNNLRLGFEAVSVAEVVEDVAAELGSEARDRLQLQLDSEGLVRGDPLLLRSLVSNALQNALKFAHSGPVSIAVRDLRTNEFSEVSIEIRDSGPGIPTELHGRVLEPFFRIEPAIASGHGLGLALIGHIARAHGGRAEFLDVSVGACLSIVLPAWRPSGKVELKASA